MSVLYVVATPIGNLMDITKRAEHVLDSVDVIAAEDTRRTNILLKHLGIEKKEMTSLHKFNEKRKTADLLARLRAGESVAVVSDAGTPLISDPGFLLVKAAWDAGIQVSPIPGASSVTAALSVCPLKCDRWSFLGFLPTKKIEREKLMTICLARPEAFVFFESPRRILKTLEFLGGKGDRKIMIIRELTKVFESMYVGAPLEVRSQIEDHLKGEILCVVEGGDAQPRTADVEKLLLNLLDYHDASTASKIAAASLGLHKKDLYRLASDLSQHKRD